VTRGKDYRVLDHPLVQAAHASAPRSVPATDCKVRWCAAETSAQKCPWGPKACATAWSSQRDRATKKKSPFGVTRAGGLSRTLRDRAFREPRFTASDVVEMYLHRGAFEPALSDEDQELDPDRWCSHSAWGQECWQIISQWVPEPGSLELGHQ
jgi:hypothetical protein